MPGPTGGRSGPPSMQFVEQKRDEHCVIYEVPPGCAGWFIMGVVALLLTGVTSPLRQWLLHELGVPPAWMDLAGLAFALLVFVGVAWLVLRLWPGLTSRRELRLERDHRRLVLAEHRVGGLREQT